MCVAGSYPGLANFIKSIKNGLDATFQGIPHTTNACNKA